MSSVSLSSVILTFIITLISDLASPSPPPFIFTSYCGRATVRFMVTGPSLFNVVTYRTSPPKPMTFVHVINYASIVLVILSFSIFYIDPESYIFMVTTFTNRYSLTISLFTNLFIIFTARTWITADVDITKRFYIIDRYLLVNW